MRKRYGQQLSDGGFPNGDFNQGIGAELIAERWGCTRADLDELSRQSHARTAAAADAGAFDGQIVTIPERPASAPTRGSDAARPWKSSPSLSRPSSRAARPRRQLLADLRRRGRAAARHAEKARALGLSAHRPLRGGRGRRRGSDHDADRPDCRHRQLLRRTGLTVDDIGAFEVNEAFASVPLAWLAETGADRSRVNPQGGAIAVGHPLGASGAVLMTKLVYQMRDRASGTGCRRCARAAGPPTRRSSS